MASKKRRQMPDEHTTRSSKFVSTAAEFLSGFETEPTKAPERPKVIRALVNGEPARSMADVVPGAELSFDGEVRVGDVMLFGEDEYYRATRDPGGGVALELVKVEENAVSAYGLLDEGSESK